MHAFAIAAVLIAGVTTAVAAPRVTRDGDLVTVSNDAIRVTIDGQHGGTIAGLSTAGGGLISANHGLYTDHGIYGQSVYVGTGSAKATVTVQTTGEAAVVRAEGTLVGQDGKAPTEPGAISYWMQYTIGDGPEMKIEWGATPGFSQEDCRAFLSYILSVVGCAGVFGNTEEGLFLQDMADHSTRTYQSASEPLSFEDPWLGVMRRDGLVVSFADLHSTVPFVNVFLHEDGNGGGAMFFGWMDGSHSIDLVAGKQWTAGCTVRVTKSLTELREMRSNGR